MFKPKEGKTSKMILTEWSPEYVNSVMKRGVKISL